MTRGTIGIIITGKELSMAKIGILGSGNVGANIAFFLAERNVADVMLFDIQEGLSKGKALDMMEAASIRNYQINIDGTDSMADALDSDICIITAGSLRAPGTKREDLFGDNKKIVTEFAESMRSYGGVVIVVTEPVDYLPTLFLRVSNIDPARVVGLGGFLDSTRLRYLISKELGVAAESVTALVVGQHSDSMVPLIDYCKVSGIPVDTLLEKSKVESIFEETIKSGETIVGLAQRASSFYGPSAVASDLCEAIVMDSNRIVSLSVRFSGQYGIDGIALSLPVIVGKKGVVRILEPKLSDVDLAKLKESAETIRRAVQA